jgi:4-hydroxy-4-methyl-2-oxoglutarate aldolase
MHALMPETLEAIRQFDTCTIANAIEKFGVRLRNEGFTRPGLTCMTGGFPRVLGYAATCKVRTADPPMTGRAYADRTDWWAAIEALPTPRIAVVHAPESEQGMGSALGEVHAAILKALGCAGVITDGAVRDLEGIVALQFPAFARHVAVSHAYSHVVDYGHPVEIFGLEVHSGDLLYADCHGVISIPRAIATQLPEAAERMRNADRRIIDFCRSPSFSAAELLNLLQKS